MSKKNSSINFKNINNKKITKEQSDNNNNNIYDETSKLNEDSNFHNLSSYIKEEKLRIRPELNDLKREVLHYGSDIIDEEDQKKYEDRPALEKLGHIIYKAYEVLEHYVHVVLSIIAAIYIIYYTNLFYNLYFNPKINKFYLYLSGFLFIVDILIFMYIYLYLPNIKKLNEDIVEKEFDEVVPYCTAIGVVAFICLIVSMWNVYRWYSIPMVLLIFWGIIMSANIVQTGMLGNIFFISIILAMLFSYKFIKGPGKTYY